MWLFCFYLYISHCEKKGRIWRSKVQLRLNHMKTLVKKVASTVLAAGVISLVAFGFPSGAFASHDGGSDPKIKEIEKVTNSSVTLPIKFEKREGDRVLVRISVENLKTGEKFTQDVKVRLSKDDGRKKVMVTDLKAGTEYKFKVKIRKTGGGDFSDWSDSRKATTSR